MLSFTDVNLQLISDTEKYQFFNSTIRVGASVICKSYARAKKFIECKSSNKKHF